MTGAIGIQVAGKRPSKAIGIQVAGASLLGRSGKIGKVIMLDDQDLVQELHVDHVTDRNLDLDDLNLAARFLSWRLQVRV